MTGRFGAAAVLALVLLVAMPALAAAHPLGNFTINHYAGLRITPDAVSIDVVIDQAEIPAFQERRDLDTDGDGDVSDAEADAARLPQCRALIPSLALDVDAQTVALRIEAAGLAFPIGAGGLPTMRLVCELRAPLTSKDGGSTSVSFTDDSYPGRVGWREVTVVGDGMIVTGSDLRPTSVSARLSSYPTALLQRPLDDRSVTFVAARGGPAASPFVAPDATPIDPPPQRAPAPAEASRAMGDSGDPSSASPSSAPRASSSEVPAVPGGIGGEIDGLLRTRDVTPLVLLASILAAAALGAGHALTPGHGKTLMGAYLIGTRGTPIHAIGLGLSVAVSHTLGILGLALAVLAAGAALPPDQFQRLAPIVSAATLTAVGAWLLVGQIRLAWRSHGRDHERDGPHDHDHDHDHGFGPHSHPARAARLSWRSLFLLGLAGGIVPSANALLILLATIATDRPGFGVVLVCAFGLGMAGVMAGVGLSLIYARDWLGSSPRVPGLGWLTAWAPPVAALFVVVVGAILTTQAVAAVSF
jgi:ABC-type nickel/cobalt efflux system permease component RcnA